MVLNSGEYLYLDSATIKTITDYKYLEDVLINNDRHFAKMGSGCFIARLNSLIWSKNISK